MGTPAPAERHWNFFGQRGGKIFLGAGSVSGLASSCGGAMPASMAVHGSAQIPCCSSLPLASDSLRQTCARCAQSALRLHEHPEPLRARVGGIVLAPGLRGDRWHATHQRESRAQSGPAAICDVEEAARAHQIRIGMITAV